MPGELEIISRIRSRARATERVAIGIGDDAAVIKHNGATDLIACCDLIVEGVHFRQEWAEPKLIGHKALAVALSDVAAMGGVPRYAMISVALPGARPARFIDELFQGIFDLADASGVSIVGGDTSSSPGPLFIDASVIGECASGRAVTRAGARTGDTIFVTGSLGASALGLLLLDQGFRLEGGRQDDSDAARSDARKNALLKHLAPAPRLRFGQAIGEAGLATAMIDVSDGLSTDLRHILDESGCGAVIRAGAIPIAEPARALAEKFEGDSLRLALHGGEEYELLFTARPENRKPLLEIANSTGTIITAIGEIIGGADLQLERDGAKEEITPAGFEHFI